MSDPLPLALVLAGGMIGGIGRYAVSGFVGRRIGETFPWGTLVVNASGALAIGILAAWLREESGGIWIAAAAGVLGSYTTVSSFSLQTLALARDGERLLAGLNVLCSLAVCLGAVLVGYVAGAILWWA